MRHSDARNARAAEPAYGRRLWVGTAMLTLAAVGLSFLAIRLDVPFSGLGAILVTFGGLIWFSIVALRRRFALFELRRGAR